jgi:hypothetical protein
MTTELGRGAQVQLAGMAKAAARGAVATGISSAGGSCSSPNVRVYRRRTHTLLLTAGDTLRPPQRADPTAETWSS